MEGEINNFFLVWSIVFASLLYCHTLGKIFPSGTARIIAISPIILLFFLLPLNFTSIHFAGITSFFISWLANFKLMLFAFNQGPLPSAPLSHFIPLACFPINIQQSQNIPSKKRPNNYVAKAMVVALLIRIYAYKEYIHPHIVLFCYCLHLYLMLEMLLALFGGLAKALLRVELQPQFNDPYLATSLQDFWGRRWNLMVSNTLHPTVYRPVRAVSARFVPLKWAPIPAVLATFLVSGVRRVLFDYPTSRLNSFQKYSRLSLGNAGWSALVVVMFSLNSIKIYLFLASAINVRTTTFYVHVGFSTNYQRLFSILSIY